MKSVTAGETSQGGCFRTEMDVVVISHFHAEGLIDFHLVVVDMDL